MKYFFCSVQHGNIHLLSHTKFITKYMLLIDAYIEIQICF